MSRKRIARLVRQCEVARRCLGEIRQLKGERVWLGPGRIAAPSYSVVEHTERTDVLAAANGAPVGGRQEYEIGAEGEIGVKADVVEDGVDRRRGVVGRGREGKDELAGG